MCYNKYWISENDQKNSNWFRTNNCGCQESDRLIGVVAVGKERFDHIVGKRQSHDGVGGWPV